MVNILIPAIRAASAPSATRSLWHNSRTAQPSTRIRMISSAVIRWLTGTGVAPAARTA
ncbi:hypothetical protein ACIBHX_51180 [Nonomuraea sp. NPDC050536]|uniref:hypothetical protein n=1 Tax=Nonomuraea sp. NPDC050536 TaxID=3364366 RepID=UPI0037CBC70D